MGVFRRALKISCELSSIQALPRIAKATTHFQLILWTTALLIGSCFCGYQFVELLLQYFKYPTSVDIKEISGSPPFPDVTICHLDIDWTIKKLHTEFGDDYDIKKFSEKLDKIMDSVRSDNTTYTNLKTIKDYWIFYIFLQNIEHIGEHKLAKLVTEQFIIDCQVDLASTMLAGDCFRNKTYKVFVDPVFGLCITIQDIEAMALHLLLYLDDEQDEKINNFDGIKNMEIMSKVGARVVLHPHNSFPDMGYFSHFVSAGTEYSFDVVGSERVSLTRPHGTCIAADQVQEEGMSSYAAFRHGFECYRLCGKLLALKECGCLHVYYNADNSNQTLCGHLEEDVSLTLKRLQCAHSILKDSLSNFKDVCDCPKPCQEFEYDYTSRTMPWPHHTYHLSFYAKYIQGRSKLFKQKFKLYNEIQVISDSNQTAALDRLKDVKLIQENFACIRVLHHQWKYLRYTETPLLSAESIIGSIGGLFNLWAGLSFFTLIEIMEFAYLWFKQKKEKLHSRMKYVENNM